MNGWLRPKHGAEYADVGERTYRTWFKKGLRSIRVKGVVLTKIEWIDEYLRPGQFWLGLPWSSGPSVPTHSRRI